MTAAAELVGLDVADAGVAARILALQRRAYRVEADLIGSEDIPPLHETADEIACSGEALVGALVDGVLVGAVS